MKDFKDRIAVVTGAASGIGLSLCRAFAQREMKVVMADIEAPALHDAAKTLETQGAKVLPVVTDVSKAGDVENLAEETLREFGAVHIVCNNAGVISGGTLWQAPIADYEWQLGVNLWGVIYGIQTFVPIMLKQETEGHIVNTASMAALTSLPYAGIYHMTKHAVLGLTESLYHELTFSGAKVKVSVLCPELIRTRIAFADRNRPSRAPTPPTPEHDLVVNALTEGMKKGVSPDIIAERVLRGIEEERFYILSDDDWRRAANLRMDDIREGRNPSFDPPVG